MVGHHDRDRELDLGMSLETQRWGGAKANGLDVCFALFLLCVLDF